MPTMCKSSWGCSSVDRALRSHRRGRGFESHQLHQLLKNNWQKGPWGYGGMVDAEDLKSFDHCDRVGSSPTIPTKTLSRESAILFRVLDVWLSWLEHYVHIVGVGGSSPPTSTKNKTHPFGCVLFFDDMVYGIDRTNAVCLVRQ